MHHRLGLYIRVGDWPRLPRELCDSDEAIERALTVQNIAENSSALYDLMPLYIRHTLLLGKMP